MKKLLTFSLLSSSLLLSTSKTIADDIYYWNLDSSGDPNEKQKKTIYKIDTATNETIKLLDYESGNSGTTGKSTFLNEYEQKIYLIGTCADDVGKCFDIYDIETNTVTEDTNKITAAAGTAIAVPKGITKNTDGTVKVGSDSETIQIGSDNSDFDVVSDGLNIDGAAVITKNADGSIQIGADGNDIDITAEGLTVDGVSLITKKESGEIHIGKNSLITKEEDGVQKLYAKDENGNAIDINVTNGSKLLIDGVEVTPTGTIPQVTTNKNNIATNKANIKNLGEGVAGSTALTAALSALPQTSKESKLSCGVGTGAYSSRYAVGFGCASKVNERVDVNAGGSYVFGGSKSYGGGTLDSGVVKAGFIFKLGELSKSTQISMKEKKEFKKEISILKENNEKIISQNKNLQLENQSIIDQNKALLSRLERLENIALTGTKSKELAVYRLK